MPDKAMDIRPLSDDEMKAVGGGTATDPMHDVPRGVSPALDAVLDGSGLDEMIDALTTEHQASQLAAMEGEARG